MGVDGVVIRVPEFEGVRIDPGIGTIIEDAAVGESGDTV